MAEEDRVIARAGDREIRYAEVWTSREIAAANPKWLRGRNVEAVCVDAEREKFRQLVTNAIIEQACAIEDCRPDDAEIDRFRSPILKDESKLQGLAALSRKVPEAVRRVYLGERIEAVYEEVIEPMGRRSLDLFRREVAMYGSLERVERYLTRDFAASARQHFEDSARKQAMRAAIRRRIEAMATAERQEIGQAADGYMTVMTERLGIRILDPRFALPSGREAFL